MKFDSTILLLILIPALNFSYAFVFGWFMRRQEKLHKAVMDTLFRKIERQGKFITYLAQCNPTFETLQAVKAFSDQEEVENTVELLNLRMVKGGRDKQERTF